MITPSFTLTATERVLPRLALDFTTASLDSRITFTRSGATATRVNSSGYVETMAADTPRFDFDPVTVVCKGLLIEEARTNLRSYSEEFNNIVWVTSNASVSANFVGITSPSGTQTADKLILNNGSSAGNIVSSLVLISGTTYTYSCYAKAGERNVVRLRIIGIAGWASAAVNLSTGAVVSNVGTVVVSDAGGGWYRIAVTATCDLTGTNAVYVYDQTGTTGNGSNGFYIWGAQVEAGSFSTSFIPTVASQVTRTADVATMTSTNFSDWYSAGAGGVVARVLPSTVSGTRPALQFDDATANEVITLRGSTTNPELVIVDGGAPQAQIDAGTIAANTAYNLGAAWNTDNCAAAVNGGAAATDTAATIPTVTQARLGSDGTNYLNGQLQTVRYWPQRIINAEVQAFSKG
jgi:hypothetical protein